MWGVASIAYGDESIESIPDEGTIPLLRKTLKTSFPIIRPIFGRLILSLVLRLAYMGLGLIEPHIIKRLFDHIFVEQSKQELFWCCILLAVIPVVRQLLKLFQDKSDFTVDNMIVKNIQLQVYNHIQQLHIRFFVDTPPGEIHSRISSDVQAINALLMSVIGNITEVFQFTITLVTLLMFEWRLTLISFASFPLLYYILIKVAIKTRENAKKTFKGSDAIDSRLTETLSVDSIFLTKIFGREKHNSDKLKKDIEEYQQSFKDNELLTEFFFFLIRYSLDLNTAVVYYFGGLFLFSNSLTVGSLIFFRQSLREVYQPLSYLMSARVTLVKQTVQVQRVFELLQLPIEIKDPIEPVTLRSEHNESSVRGDIELASVSLDYSLLPPLTIEVVDRFWQKNAAEGKTPKQNKARDWAIQNISVKFRAGTVNAIVGKSGAGKSTLLKLVHRLFDPTQGLVTLDGIDIRQLRLEELIGYMGVVSQDSFFFNDTIKNNLLFAKPDATDADIERACRTANVWALIDTFANKLDEKIGENGYKLSGGERQRLSIARTILKNPKIILLDEATSHLDSENENLIKSALDVLFKDRTSLVIAHRLSTILDADQIVVMDNGRVVEWLARRADGTRRTLQGLVRCPVLETKRTLTAVNTNKNTNHISGHCK